MRKQPVLAVLLLLCAAAVSQTTNPSKGPLVFINGSGATSVVAQLGQASVSKHDQTIEMAEQLSRHCPEITVTLKSAEPTPDYDLVLNRDSVGLFDEGVSQFMLVRSSDQIVMYASKKGTVAKAMKDGCKVLLADWKQKHVSPTPARAHTDGDYWQKSKVEPAK